MYFSINLYVLRKLYSLGIYIASFVINALALSNTKLKQGVIGRKETFKKLKNTINPDDKTFWFHCASLGEYEQGLPVFEALKAKHPNYKVVLSFFSPSGYNVRKHTKIADVVVYLPLDTTRNAKRFLDLVNPDYTVFVKYEIWANLLNEVKRRSIKAILISAVFRKDHHFFKWYGGFMASALFAFEHIFTQDENSKQLLKTIAYTTVTVSGDTRFDRVSNQLHIDNSVPFIKPFKNDAMCVVLGSTWPDDDVLFINYINKQASSRLKFIIAPHTIKTSYINTLKQQLTVKTICYSEKENKDLGDYNVFILNTIGYLSKVYSYADIAYVGGGAGKTGLHNILEPAVFGLPILIGKHYNKFLEAKALVDLGGVISVSNAVAFENTMTKLVKNVKTRTALSSINTVFINTNKGAVNQILSYIKL